MSQLPREAGLYLTLEMRKCYKPSETHLGLITFRNKIINLSYAKKKKKERKKKKNLWEKKTKDLKR